MKSWWIRSQDGGTVLEVRDIPLPAPGPGQVLVKVHAASLNRGDMMAAIARHRAAEARLAGVDAAGEVHALGAGVSAFRQGERVMLRTRGAFAEYIVAEADLATPVPAHLSWEQAAAIPVAFVTAWESVVQLGKLGRGQWLLVAGVSSGVGVACMQIGRIMDARVIGVSGSAEKLARLRELGLEFGIRARASDFAERALALTEGRGVDVAVNLVGGTAFAGCQRVLTDFGRLSVVGYVDTVMKAEVDLEALHGRRHEIVGVSNSPLTAAQRAVATRGFVRDVLPAIADGRITPVIDRVFGFDEAPAAKAYAETNALLGKVILRV